MDSRSAQFLPWIIVFSANVCSPINWQPAPMIQLFVTFTADDTKHLHSNRFFSPIFNASTREPTSNTLFAPITSTGGFAIALVSSPVSWIIVVYSSIRQFSPMMIGPDLAMIVTRGWMIHPLDTVISPEKVLSSHSQTIALGIIFNLNQTKGYRQMKCKDFELFPHIILFSTYSLFLFDIFFYSFFLLLLLHLNKNQHRDDVKKHKYYDQLTIAMRTAPSDAGSRKQSPVCVWVCRMTGVVVEIFHHSCTCCTHFGDITFACFVSRLIAYDVFRYDKIKLWNSFCVGIWTLFLYEFSSRKKKLPNQNLIIRNTYLFFNWHVPYADTFIFFFDIHFEVISNCLCAFECSREKLISVA